MQWGGGVGLPDRLLQVDDEVGVEGGVACVVGVGSIHALRDVRSL
jgi:hypothetical protein